MTLNGNNICLEKPKEYFITKILCPLLKIKLRSNHNYRYQRIKHKKPKIVHVYYYCTNVKIWFIHVDFISLR